MNDKVTIDLVHERDTYRKSVYSETFPGAVLYQVYMDTDSLRQAFGEIPVKLTVSIEKNR